jgi:hypothetical protein
MRGGRGGEICSEGAAAMGGFMRRIAGPDATRRDAAAEGSLSPPDRLCAGPWFPNPSTYPRRVVSRTTLDTENSEVDFRGNDGFGCASPDQEFRRSPGLDRLFEGGG